MAGMTEASHHVSLVGPGAAGPGRRHSSFSRCLETRKVLLCVNPWHTLPMEKEHSLLLLEVHTLCRALGSQVRRRKGSVRREATCSHRGSSSR